MCVAVVLVEPNYFLGALFLEYMFVIAEIVLGEDEADDSLYKFWYVDCHVL